MAYITLHKGEVYTFGRVGGQTLILDSSDHKHAQKIFRQSIHVIGSEDASDGGMQAQIRLMDHDAEKTLVQLGRVGSTDGALGNNKAGRILIKDNNRNNIDLSSRGTSFIKGLASNDPVFMITSSAQSTNDIFKIMQSDGTSTAATWRFVGNSTSGYSTYFVMDNQRSHIYTDSAFREFWITSGDNLILTSSDDTVVGAFDDVWIKTEGKNVAKFDQDQNVTVYEDFTVVGTKSFQIKHPDPDKHDEYVLRHSTVESPTCGENLYRWQVTVTGSYTNIKLPDYYKFLNSNDQVWVSPYKHFGNAWGEVDVAQTTLTIHVDSCGVYNVMLVGTRKDEGALKSNITKYGVETAISNSSLGEK
jgi:hypothetical protein